MIHFVRTCAYLPILSGYDFSSASYGGSWWTMEPHMTFDQPIDIPATSTQAFYVTFLLGGKLLISAGYGTVAEDDNVVIYDGPALEQPFINAGYTSNYSWNGAVIYKTNPISPPPKPTARPTTHKPSTRTPTTRKPSTRKPTTRKPTTRKPTTRKPTTRKPTQVPTNEPTTESPTTESPTTESPTTAQPTSKPTTRKPTTRKPSTRKPSTRKPSTRNPSASNLFGRSR
jgi:hypothetical protein